MKLIIALILVAILVYSSHNVYGKDKDNINGDNEGPRIPFSVTNIKNSHCIEYNDNFLDHAEIKILKYGSDTVSNNASDWYDCKDTWRLTANYLISNLNYRVTFDGVTAIFLQGQPIQEPVPETNESTPTQEEPSKKSVEKLSNNSTLEDTSKNTTFENLQNKNCPPMSLVLCEGGIQCPNGYHRSPNGDCERASKD